MMWHMVGHTFRMVQELIFLLIQGIFQISYWRGWKMWKVYGKTKECHFGCQGKEVQLLGTDGNPTNTINTNLMTIFCSLKAFTDLQIDHYRS